MAMSLGRRIAVLVVTALMALMMVAGPVASAADADHLAKSQGKNSGWGDGNGHGKGHPKKNKLGGGGDFPNP
jgi:Xaa-Pro aminopeptidase